MSISIRLATTDDAAEIADIYHPVVAETAISFEGDPPNAAEMARRIAEKGKSHPWLVCTCDDHVLAYAYAGLFRARPAYRWSVETSVYVDPSARRRGIGRGLYTALLQVVEAQGYHAAYAAITLPNPASVRLHEKMGFHPVGVFRHAGFKMGAWHDVGWWQRIPRPGGPPGRIRELRDLVRDPEWFGHMEAGRACVRDPL